MAFLCNVKESDYTSLRDGLDLSDGHMSTHMKELVSNEYVEMEKSFVDNKPKTTYRVTSKGRKAFTNYVSVLKDIISNA